MCIKKDFGLRKPFISMTKSKDSTIQNLLIPGIDPEPVEIINNGSQSPFLFVCEHAGNAIPQKLNGLGLPASKLELHIAVDIGARSVATKLAQRLACTLILQRYSRLVIDCNRPIGTAGSIPAVSDSITIPGNHHITTQNRIQREVSIFAPYATQCKTKIAHHNIGFVYSIHSFTPRMNGQNRPWDIGFLYRNRSSRGEQLAALFHNLWPDLSVGLNQPYFIEDETDWFIPVCAETRGVPHCLIEIRNDHLRTAKDCDLWAERLYQLFTQFKNQSDATYS